MIVGIKLLIFAHIYFIICMLFIWVAYHLFIESIVIVVTKCRLNEIEVKHKLPIINLKKIYKVSKQNSFTSKSASLPFKVSKDFKICLKILI